MYSFLQWSDYPTFGGGSRSDYPIFQEAIGPILTSWVTKLTIALAFRSQTSLVFEYLSANAVLMSKGLAIEAEILVITDCAIVQLHDEFFAMKDS